MFAREKLQAARSFPDQRDAKIGDDKKRRQQENTVNDHSQMLNAKDL
jgi:hypothetical protein